MIHIRTQLAHMETLLIGSSLLDTCSLITSLAWQRKKKNKITSKKMARIMSYVYKLAIKNNPQCQAESDDCDYGSSYSCVVKLFFDESQGVLSSQRRNNDQYNAIK